MHTYLRALTIAILTAGTLLGGVTGVNAQTEPAALSVEAASLPETGATDTTDVVITGTLTNGLSGAELTFTLPPDIARIEAVQYNNAFELTNDSELSLPAATTTLKVADLTGDFTGTTSDIHVATVTVGGAGSGDGTIAVEPSGAKVQDVDDNVIPLDRTTASLTVGGTDDTSTPAPPPAPSPTDTNSEGDSDDVSSPPPAPDPTEVQPPSFSLSGDSSAGAYGGAPFTKALDRGTWDPQVGVLQLLLREELDTYDGRVTGYFGPTTQMAVFTFQKQRGISSWGAPGSGRVGPRTRLALNRTWQNLDGRQQRLLDMQGQLFALQANAFGSLVDLKSSLNRRLIEVTLRGGL